MDASQIITIVIAVFGFLFAGIYLTKFKTVIKEVKEFFNVVDSALEDNKISKGELKKIIKEGKDIIQVFWKKE